MKSMPCWLFQWKKYLYHNLVQRSTLPVSPSPLSASRVCGKWAKGLNVAGMLHFKRPLFSFGFYFVNNKQKSIRYTRKLQLPLHVWDLEYPPSDHQRLFPSQPSSEREDKHKWAGIPQLPPASCHFQTALKRKSLYGCC